MITPSPLLLNPILMDKVWGGRRLEKLGKALPSGKNIGESWELADLASTSPSGGGGQAAISTIASGPLAGRTLREALEMWQRAALGTVELTPSGGFPLLVKFLDARENLSVQVHPSAAHAGANKDAHLKTECWYILAAEPGSVIYKGVKPGVTRASFEKKLSSGASIVDDLVAVPAVVGECHNLPSGTVHALGAGVLVAEVQTPSDTTYRVYDWGRSGRELHVEQALECIDFGPAPEAAKLPKGKTSARLVSTEFFRVYESVLPAGGVLSITGDKGGGAGGGASQEPHVLIVLEGSVSVRFGREDPVAVPTGGTCFIPAACTTSVQCLAKPRTRALTVLVR
jgi:mannose-6-phosphate isomerase